ncbi:hypothetical protein [Shewanella sedimentimangrovi]|uniref:Uncharacterized protein n=1 Tax=Shewanella sedimentimangrovi TaxID=2814293 RepID=A0ABX7R391_9GAMM|nr:hypothetical protein [Shewanella sedimentimangrovi]QSX37969.1 hypothetical protein JYB85_03770 [Shewanella sedimentimangrovi]
MNLLTLILSFLVSSAAYAGDDSDWLKANNLNGYFPQEAKYVNFPNLCNENTCFNLVAVSYVTETNKGMRRLAVFSGSGDYLGVYSGFQEMPVKVVGTSLVFPVSEYGYFINFSGSQPPATAYIDGENFEFESKP